MKKHFFYYLALLMIVITGCQKEVSFELGNTPAKGSLQSDVSGDCLPKTVNGVYEATKPLVPATNTITVSVNVTSTGIYTITTDTVNGYYFRATGTFTTLGANTVTLRSNGTPFVDGIDNFVVSYDGTICDIAVEVLPAGAGGPATFTLVSGGSPVNCASAAVSGTYVTNGVLNPLTQYVDIQVNVTAIGTYTITATGGGMTFTKTGAFTAIGPATVRLNGGGTAPATAGPVTVTLAAPFASCSFMVTVAAPVTGTLGGAGGTCTPITPSGTYTQGIVPPAGNTVQVEITTAAVGPYSVTTNTIGGLSFSASGTSTGGTQTITLLNNGVAPTVSGPQTFTVTFGTSTCTFSITIAAAPAVEWKFTEGGSTVYQGETVACLVTSILPPFLTMAYTGMDVPGNQIGINLIDASGTINVGETYSTVISAGNSAVFTFFLAGGGDQWMTDATRNLTFTVTSHNVPGKIITGTFTGQVKNNAGTTKNITLGEFTADYN